MSVAIDSAQKAILRPVPVREAADATRRRTRAKAQAQAAQRRWGGVSEHGLLIRLFSPQRLHIARNVSFGFDFLALGEIESESVLVQ